MNEFSVFFSLHYHDPLYTQFVSMKSLACLHQPYLHWWHSSIACTLAFWILTSHLVQGLWKTLDANWGTCNSHSKEQRAPPVLVACTWGKWTSDINHILHHPSVYQTLRKPGHKARFLNCRFHSGIPLPLQWCWWLVGMQHFSFRVWLPVLVGSGHICMKVQVNSWPKCCSLLVSSCWWIFANQHVAPG